MKLTFLGTRGYIDHATRRHRRHSVLMAAWRGARVMIDCGLDWRGKLDDLDPDAILITHAHPDHAFGLEDGASCPVYAPAEAWQAMQDYPIEKRITVAPRRPIRVSGMTVEAFPVIHSLRAPAVGYRLRAGRTVVFYVPDVVDIVDRAEALSGAELYIGDGATMTRPLVRRRGDRLFGHTTVRAQLGWCQEAGVPRAVFTHCGSGIVTGDERRIGARLRAMGRERGVAASIAHDGMEIVLR